MFEALFGSEMPLALRFAIAFVFLIFLVGVVVYFLSVLWRRRTVSHAASSNSMREEIERSISEVVHKAYDHRDTDDVPANIGLTEQLAKLAKLHADGALSDEDFKALKAKLISRVSDKHTDARDRDFALVGRMASERDQISASHVPIPAKMGGMKSFLIILSCIVAGILLIRLLLMPMPAHLVGGPKITAQIDGVVLSFINVDPTPITLQKVNVNNRPECLEPVVAPGWVFWSKVPSSELLQMMQAKLLPQMLPVLALMGVAGQPPVSETTLKTGDTVFVIVMSCTIVTVDLETDRGPLHWDFSK